jgi:monofunctional biosynthetic peptidoglycan transglycosylase
LAQRSKNRKKIVIIFFLLFTGLLLYLLFVPDIATLKKENPKKTSFMKYREREWKRDGKPYKIQQQWVSLSRISPYLMKAVLIAEDDKFWGHQGFDYDAIRKALEKDVKQKKFTLGGSTITQQLTKNLYLSPAKNPLRKIREAIITWRIESILSKKRILELYLNVAEWGDYGIFGIEAASRHYYGKPASSLDAHEASRLAAILPNPRKYSPLDNSRYVLHRAHIIHSIMVKRGIVIPEYREVVEEEAQSNRENKPDTEPSPENQ